MKRILNLNNFSGPVLKVILSIGLGLPAGLVLLNYVLEQAGLHLPLLEHAIWFLLAAGGVALLLFLGLVILERIQDNLLYRRYLRERGQHINEECPYCGNRQLRPFEYACSV